VLVLPRIGAMAIAGSVALYVASAPWLFIAVYGWAANQFGDWKVASAGARLDIWRVVAKLALERPFTGHGPNALRRMENIFSPEDVFMSGAGKTGAFHPHNFALQVWLDLGVAGAIAFIALILFAFWRMSALTRPLAAAGCAMLVAIIVVGSLSPGLWQGWWLGAIALAVCQFVVATKEREPFAIDQIGIRKERLG
ncbi:MAG: O-antigen ligase family protein, partial [Pseudomonadota bacterium]